MDKLLPGVDAAVAAVSRAGGLTAADAIRTTDTVVKIAFRHGQDDARRPTPSAAWPRAPGCSRRRWPPCCAC